MHRNVTAIYRTRDVAEKVRRGLEDIGVPGRDIHIVPDPAHDTATGRSAEMGDRTQGTAGSTTTGTTTGMGAGAAPRGTTASAHEHPLHHANPLEAGADDERHHAYDRLHELHLPEEDVRTYQHAVRRGDYVVSAEVDEDKVEKVKAIMRRPETEAWDIEHRGSEFRNETLIAHSAGEGHMLNEDRRARRLAVGDDDRYTRTYERNQRLDNQGRR